MNSSMKRMVHRYDREDKRIAARDRARRLERIADDILNDGLTETRVTAAINVDAHAKTVYGSMSVVDLWDDTRWDDLAGWEQALILDDAHAENRAFDDALEEQAWAEFREQEERERWDREDKEAEAYAREHPQVWPPACTMHDIEESHRFYDRGFIVTNSPWGATR